MGLVVEFFSNGIFSGEVSVDITYEDFAAPFEAVVTGKEVDLTIGTDGGVPFDNTIATWTQIAADFNAQISPDLATAVGTPQNSTFPGSGPLSSGSSGQGQGQFFFALTPAPPVVVPVTIPQGSKAPPPKPNDYTMCLVREFHLFKEIEFSKLECCPGRECIITDYVEAVGIGYEETSDGLAFNPTNAIPLPAPSDGEVVVLTEVVPIGYDGMLLAQFHGYIQSPSGTALSSFTEGSGDIAWRITSNNRYLKDCGNMLVSIGSTQRLAPIYGGIRVRSGDTITYRVQVYNLSDLLTPGIGSIIAGLHGFFYPRK